MGRIDFAELKRVLYNERELIDWLTRNTFQSASEFEVARGANTPSLPPQKNAPRQVSAARRISLNAQSTPKRTKQHDYTTGTIRLQ